MKSRSLLLVALVLFVLKLHAESWQETLSRMPLVKPVRVLNRTNCVDVLLNSLASNQTVRALVMMPGATDELYFFHRINASITNDAPTLLDAVVALTNQTYIQATWRPPMLLLHTVEDDTRPQAVVKSESTAAKLRERAFLPHAVYNDWDWDHLMPVLKKQLKVGFHPWRGRIEANHFYRHSFAEWNLNGWETLEAVALAGKTVFTVKWHKVVFEGDERFPAPPPGRIPPLDSFVREFGKGKTDAASTPK